MLSSRHKHTYLNKFIFIMRILALGSLINSCGYTALYDERAGKSLSVKKQLALIQIQPIKDRIGQYLHNDLLNSLNPMGKPTNPLYSLNVNLEEQSSNLGVKKSAVVTRGNLRVTATFTLSEIVNSNSGIENKNLLTATVMSISSYDIPQAQYAALAALKDARTRALGEITENIRTRLGIYFHQGH